MIFPQNVPAPTPEKVPHEMSLHGDRRVDPFFWMKERDSERVLKHLRAENSYYEQMTKAWKPLEDRLFEEMKARVKQDDSSPPAKDGPFMYYSRFAKGLEYPIYCRKKIGGGGNEEIILDVNAVAKGHKYTSVSGVGPSPDHTMIVYGVDTVGRRFYDLHFRDLKSGKTMKQTVPKTTGEVVWAEDGHTLFYTVQNPETLRSEKVLRFDLKTGKSTEIYFEKDEIFSVGVGKSQNRKYIFIQTGSFDSSEYRYVSAADPTAEFKTFLPREPKHEYMLEDGDDAFYVMTNWQAENFRVMKVSPQKTSKENWHEVIPHRKEVLLSAMLMLKNQLVVYERSSGLTQLEIFDRHKLEKNSDAHSVPAAEYVKFPDAAYEVELGANHEYDIDYIRYHYQSMVRPDSVFDYHFGTKSSSLVKALEVPTYDATKYQSERVWATADDGTKIPISVVFRKDKRNPGKNPLFVYGYGSYGLSMDPGFTQTVVSLLDRGFVYAIAHIRGGSEMGRAWYEKGRMGFKKNTFTDFNAATEFLVKNGFGDPAKVFASGGSAGGLLMGAIANLRPELYRGIVSVVPFVDVLTTMLDPDIPLTTAEYEQWGNPNEKDPYHYIKSYSPYDNIERKAYPAVFVMTGYHDSQVQYWEPAKYVAKLRELTTSSQPVLFKIDMEAGHSGASGRFAALRDTAARFAFVIKLAGAE